MTTTMASERMTLTASLTPEEGGYVARCLELPVVSEGDSVDEALEMLREAVELYLEEQPSPAALPVVESSTSPSRLREPPHPARPSVRASLRSPAQAGG